MTIETLTVQQAALHVFNLSGGKADPERVAEIFREGAKDLRYVAKRAAKAPSGRFRKYTAADATRLAEVMEERAVTVPAELRRLQAAG